MSRQISIDPLSGIPLFLDCYDNETPIFSGTGFLVQQNGSFFLITNYHLLSGINPYTGQPIDENGTLPNKIGIWHHKIERLGIWELVIDSLKNSDGSPKWLEHPNGNKIDVAALPITVDAGVQTYPLDLTLSKTDLVLHPSEPVSIIGFPFGYTTIGKFPIWKTGHIASDIELDYNDLPMFLIDSTTKPGMSGSPVIARRIGMYQSSKALQMGGTVTRFLGVFSGHIHPQIDVGMVWKPHVISTILS